MNRKARNVITTTASPLKPNQRLYIFKSKREDATPDEDLTLKGSSVTAIENKIIHNGSVVHNDSKTLIPKSLVNDKTNSSSSILWPAPNAEKTDNVGVAYAEDAVKVNENNAMTQNDCLNESKNPQEYQSTSNSTVYRLEEEQDDEEEGDNLNDHHCNYRDLYEETKEKIHSLDSKLEVQLNVNMELKRLLVASIGDDIGLKLEELTKDKTELAIQMEDYTKQIIEDREKLDNAAMKCNVWRSKFLASRVMIEQLIHWKLEMYDLLKDYHNSVKKLLNERLTLSKDLVISSRNLESIYQSVSPRKSSFEAAKEYHKDKDITSICKDNKELIELISNCMSVQPDTIASFYTLNPTDAERLLQQLSLEIDKTEILDYNLERFSLSLAKDVDKHFKIYRERKLTTVEKMAKSQSFKESIHKIAQDFDFPAIDCCPQCKGKIFLV